MHEFYGIGPRLAIVDCSFNYPPLIGSPLTSARHRQRELNEALDDIFQENGWMRFQLVVHRSEPPTQKNIFQKPSFQRWGISRLQYPIIIFVRRWKMVLVGCSSNLSLGGQRLWLSGLVEDIQSWGRGFELHQVFMPLTVNSNLRQMLKNCVRVHLVLGCHGFFLTRRSWVQFQQPPKLFRATY